MVYKGKRSIDLPDLKLYVEVSCLVWMKESVLLLEDFYN